MRLEVGEKRSTSVGVLGLVVLALFACKSQQEQPQAEQPVAAPQPDPQLNVEPPPEPAQPVAAALSFTLSHSSINQGESVKLTFSQAVNPASGKNWVTIVPAGKPDNDWGSGSTCLLARRASS